MNVSDKQLVLSESYISIKSIARDPAAVGVGGGDCCIAGEGRGRAVWNVLNNVSRNWASFNYNARLRPL